MAVAIDSGPSLGKATAAESSAADLGPPPGSAVIRAIPRAPVAARAASRRLSHSSCMLSNGLGSWDMVCDGDMRCGKQRDV